MIVLLLYSVSAAGSPPLCSNGLRDRVQMNSEQPWTPAAEHKNPGFRQYAGHIRHDRDFAHKFASSLDCVRETMGSLQNTGELASSLEHTREF